MKYYYFNSQMKLVVGRRKKRKHDSLEIVSEFSWQAQGDVKEKNPKDSLKPQEILLITTNII